jgi:phage N-6-adenine-methyltransferase
MTTTTVVQSVHFLSLTDEWETPPAFFAEWDARYHFTLDVCATPENAKCQRYYTRAEDGLAQEWTGVCWMNPPYGRQIGRWVQKAYEAAQSGATVVCLLPARTDTAWWHDYVMRGKVTFIRGRLRFVGGASSAPFPSAVVVFEPEKARPPLEAPTT